ncbi:MAG: response regulator [Candidatus Obscuribacterales bacterium]|nr:response regulator [Candidatus Obscuribacterales bacterium]
MKAPIQVLLAEDNPDDALLLKEALADTRIDHVLTTVSDGTEVLAYLAGEAPFESTQKPDILFLDLNMPKMGGLDVLQELNKRGVSKIPIVVLTVSNDKEEILQALKLRMNYYIRKPVDDSQLKPLLSLISDMWYPQEAS